MMSNESHMVRSTAPHLSLPSTYNDFLYALSARIRMDVPDRSFHARAPELDPWEEAAGLSRLPRDGAKQKLVSMITASSWASPSSTTAELRAVADRVLALLPGCASMDKSRDVSAGAPPPG